MEAHKIINNLTEDYCSFEVSKLLKEKGFNCFTHLAFTKDGGWTGYDGGAYSGTGAPQGYNHFNLEDKYYARPTYYVAIKWIRENFDIHIEPKVWWGGTVKYQYFASAIQRKGDNWSDKFKPRTKTFNSPEEATEAALRYVLENLV